MSSQLTPYDKYLKKSVAWVTPILGRHGKLMYMEPLLSALKDQCKEFSVITATYPANTENAPFNILIGSKLRVLYWKGKSSYLIGLTFIGPAFYKTIKNSNPEVLFLVEFGFTTIYGLIFSTIHRKTKTILLVESKPIDCDGIILRTMRKLMRRIIVKQCDAILTNNQSGKEYLTNQLNADPAKIIAEPYLISETSNPTLIDNERFHSLDTSSIINFLFVGQIIERKGLQHLIEAMKLIPKKDRDRIHINIVGEGNYLDSLSKLITINKLDTNFKFHGRVEYSELSKFYSSAHVFIFPTLSDYRALSPFEALSAGLPIISSIYDGGSSENAIEGVNGHVCDPTDAVAFSRIIKDILDHPEKLYQYSLKSMEISKKYTIDNAITSMLSAAELAMSKSR